MPAASIVRQSSPGRQGQGLNSAASGARIVVESVVQFAAYNKEEIEMDFRLRSIIAGPLGATLMMLAGQRASGQHWSPQDFEDAKSLKAATDVVKEKLKQDGKPEYASLVTESRVREAIRKAIQSYEKVLEKHESQNSGSKEYFEKAVKPIYLKIADAGEWPRGCSFFSFYKLTESNTTYDCLGLRLQIDTPQAKFKAFALPITDVYFGRFSG